MFQFQNAAHISEFPQVCSLGSGPIRWGSLVVAFSRWVFPCFPRQNLYLVTLNVLTNG